MKKISLLVVIHLLCCSCATGPVRYHTMGKYEYLTSEMIEKHGEIIAPVGVMLDTLISAGDTISVALASIPTSLTFVSKDGPKVSWDESTPASEYLPLLPLNLLFLPVTYPINLYRNSYGIERESSPYWGIEGAIKKAPVPSR